MHNQAPPMGPAPETDNEECAQESGEKLQTIQSTPADSLENHSQMQ